jgi:hypothetical protein
MNRIRLFVTLSASAVLLAALACTPATSPSQLEATSTEAAPVEVVDESPSPAQVVAPDPTPPDASSVAARDSLELLRQSGPVLEGIGRWAKARGARLPAQGDEFESLRAQTVHLEERARAIRQSTTSDPSISSHVRRSADANAQALNEVVITVDLVQQIFDIASKQQPNTADAARAQTLLHLVEDHLKHVTSLMSISVDELKAYSAATA